MLDRKFSNLFKNSCICSISFGAFLTCKKETYGIEHTIFSNVSGKSSSEYSTINDLTGNLYSDSDEYEKYTLAKCNDFNCFKFVKKRKIFFVAVSASVKFFNTKWDIGGDVVEEKSNG